MDTQKVAVIGNGPVENSIVEKLNQLENVDVLTVDELQNADTIDTSTVRVDEKSTHDYKVDKFKALYQCRLILSKHGTMKEREVCKAQLKRMQKLGLGAI